MANTDDSKTQYTKPHLTDGQIASFADLICKVIPEQLPDNRNQLQLLQQYVSDAIAVFDNWVSALKSAQKLYGIYEESLKSTGKEPLLHMPEISAVEPAQHNAVRWDWIGKYLDGNQQLSLLICRKAMQDDLSRWKSWLAPLSYTEVVDELARQLGIQCPADMNRDEFRQRVVKNYSASTQIQEDKKLILGLELSAIALKKLDDKIAEKLNEAEFLFAGWKSPKQWRAIYEEFGDSISEKTWQRRIKDRTIRIHPNSTSKRAAVHVSSLPPGYVKKLTADPS